jgi:ATP-dependent DNA helicase RecQ
VIPDADVMTALRRYWGYDSFRPLQHNIVKSLLGGRDACVVMPTGGGKSLCYQLPAALLTKQTVIVISPLIALMQDQVAQLTQMGIEAALLNSSLPNKEQAEIVRRAAEGRYRLLYVSPERLARADTLGWLERVPISLFAIDEAHCISEWGHEFRPEYRQLSRLRERFPASSIAAFTASATRRVRHDIIAQLQMSNPDKYIASFHRPNLRYIVKQCEAGTQTNLLLESLRQYPGRTSIVYAPTIARVEETVDFLEEHDIAAIGYHGRMDSLARRQNQERWMSDEVPVLVGTIAFGLGINKPGVRTVIHLSLPKSIEQYYQEAGRAGRDGEPANCVLLWQKRDAALLAHFTKEINDLAERKRAWQRYDEIRGLVESRDCRHRQICSHFGENPKWRSCEACDVCGGEPQWLQAPSRSSKQKKSKPSRASHPETLTRPSTRPSGTQPMLLAEGQIPDTSGADPDLREYLREWRRLTAKELGVPAYVVMHDTSLDEICRLRPTSLAGVRSVPGFGERKTALYAQRILDALTRFQNHARAATMPQKTSKPAEETARLLAEGRTFAEIAAIRGREVRTIISMVADLVEQGQLDLHSGWLDPCRRRQIEEACARLGLKRMRTIKDALPPDFTFEEIRLVAAHLRHQLD